MAVIRSRLARTLGGICVLLLPLCAPAAETSVEFRLKAAFLLNFAKLVQWPESRFSGVADPLRLCVLGADPFGKGLDDTVAGKRVGERAIAVRRADEARALADCHLVYLGAGERARYVQHMQALAGNSILTVDEGEGFTLPQGMIRFYLDKQRIRFELNPGAVEQAQLKMDPKLVQIAKIVAR